MAKKLNTKITWQNRLGELRVRHMGGQCTYFYALNCFRENIAECQWLATLSLDDRRNSKFKLVSIENYVGDEPPSGAIQFK